jgi:hypothetical protein
MTKAKIAASLLVIVPIIVTLLLITAIPVPVQNENINPTIKNYITSEEVSKEFSTVWTIESLMFFVNHTQETYLNFYNWTYNATSQIATSELIDSWRINHTSKLVYSNTNAPETMQWALTQGGVIKLSGGNYNLSTSTLKISHPNLSLIGEGGILTYNGNGPAIYVSSNVSGVCISGLIIDMRGIKNTTGLEIK